MELKCGMPVKSKAGRDKGCIYIIGDVKNEYVYLADGSSRPLCRMKKKNRKHLQLILKIWLSILERKISILSRKEMSNQSPEADDRSTRNPVPNTRKVQSPNKTK